MSEKHLSISQDNFIDLVGLIYDAATDPDSWVIFLKRFADVLGGVGPNLFVQDLETNSGQIYESDSDPHYQQLYANHFSKLNEWLIRGKHLMQPGKLRVGQMVISEQELRRTEYYNDWLRPQNFLHGCGATILQTGSLTSIFSMFRPHGRPPFEDEDIATAEALIPHLQRAINLHHHFGDLDRTIKGSWEVLERLNIGVIVLNEKAKIIFINKICKEIIDQKDGLTIHAGSLSALRSVAATALRRLISEVIQTALGKGTGVGGEIQVQRPSMLRPYSFVVSALSHQALRFSPNGAAIIFVQDPEMKKERSEQEVSRLHRFTPAEARLAIKLTQGKSIQDAADELLVSVNTIKSQLSSMFLKTNTNRQSDLIRHLLMSLDQLKH